MPRHHHGPDRPAEPDLGLPALAERKGRRLDDTGCIVFRIVGDKVTDLDECVEDIDKSNEFWAD